jgi:hypothetical protein
MTKKKSKTKILDTGPQLIINNIKDIYKSYLKTISENDTVEIKTKIIENIDLSGIQFLHFAQNHAKQQHKVLKINFSYSDIAKELLSKSGFTNFL